MSESAKPGNAIESPEPSSDNGVWGSDVVAEMLRVLDVPYVALNPGASFRGLHDSLVNRLGNRAPQMLLCLHEEAAVAIAHGWAKVTGRPMGAIVHSNVGLMHGSMGVFNAWCDRAPLLLLGATGPVDAAKRRPWIDWIHTAKDQGALIRDFTKWDDQPASAGAAVEAMLRAWQIINTAPMGPAYICLDAALQEARLDSAPDLPDPKRFAPPPLSSPSPELVADATGRLKAAKRPLILMGRVGRGDQQWRDRIQLAEALGAIVLTDMKVAGAFPTAHPNNGGVPAIFLSEKSAELLRQADIILALDWVDLAGTLNSAGGAQKITAPVINVSLDQTIHNGWSMDHQGLPPADIYMLADPDVTVSALLDALGGASSGRGKWTDYKKQEIAERPAAAPDEIISVPLLARAVNNAMDDRETCLIRHPLSWAGHLWDINHPLDFLGTDGGGGIGSGPGTVIGAALALRDSGRIPLAILGDGDFMMGNSAIWTAVHYQIPAFILIANNRSFYNDEVHQERVAQIRSRPVENKWIGQQIFGPDIDFAMIARGQGATAFGPIETVGALDAVLPEALAAYDRGETIVIDVRVAPGYDPSMTGGLIKSHDRAE